MDIESTRRWTRSLAVVATLGCAQEPAPETMPSSEPLPTSSYPDRFTVPSVVEIAERCDLLVETERSVDRALIKTRKGVVRSVKVIGGHQLEIICPEDRAERDDVIVLAEIAVDHSPHSLVNVVRWVVDLDSDVEIERVSVEYASPGLPGDLNPEDLAQIRFEWPDMIEWQGESTPRALPAEATPAKRVEREQVSVVFMSGRLKWADIVFVNQATQRKRKSTLNPRATRLLEPGVYSLSARYPEGSEEWRDAGTFEIGAGATSIEIKLVESPQLHAVVTVE